MHSIEKVFDAFKSLKVLVIGDVMIDSYIWGKVDRISPEAPVPVIHINRKENRPGGAANVARNIKSLGAQPVLCSVIGNELTGKEFLDLLAQEDIQTTGMVMSDARLTTVKQRVLSGSQHLLRIDAESDKPLGIDERNALLQKISSHIANADVVIFEDYDKGVIDDIVISKVVQMAAAKGIPVAVDPKKRNFNHYQNVTLFKPNLKEIKEGLKLDADYLDNDLLVRAADQLKKQLNVPMILVTLSERGVFISGPGQDTFFPAHIRTISDVSGAGDTVISTAALCLALGLPPSFMACLSNLAGGLVCEHPGVVPVPKDQLLEEAMKKIQPDLLNKLEHI
ncbi:MAG: D-glycero-beta-D-manno-heptose-7-phosphate kinase [Cyclobacteriaceae bacterium]|nr:D-glycero-beta-D-manno-heptose-7-phosphate kinase [Cyclobacteriaceae bacterium]